MSRCFHTAFVAQFTGAALITAILAGCGAQSTQSQSSLPSPPSASSGSAGASAGSVGASAGSVGASAGSVGASAGSVGTSAGSAGVSVGSAGASAGSAGASAGSAGASAGSVSVSVGSAGASTGSINLPGDPSPGSSRSGGRDGSGQQQAGSNRRGQHSNQPPNLDEGSSNPIEDFSEYSSGAAGGASTAERVAELDGALDNSISDYDGMILRERENMANRANAAGSEAQLNEEDVSGPLFDEIGSAKPEQEGPGAAYESSGGGNQPAGGNNRPGDYAPTGSGAPPADIPSGNDDDIVARQIREAAMKETDPELREKLWEEYRKYKNQQ